MRKFLQIVVALILSLFCAQAQKTFTVVIDAGHGGKDPGAIGATSKEKNINLSVALKLGALIKQKNADVRVIYTRRTDVFIPLDERANIANRNKADLFISIHTNSVKKGNTACGAETYTIGLANSDENLDVAMRENSVILMEDNYLQKYEGFDPQSSESYIIFEFMQNKHMEQSVSFASDIQKSFKKAKRQNRGVRQAGLLVLRKTSMPGVLVELGFISNKSEERFLNSKSGQKTLTQAIYKAFEEYKYDYDRKLGNISGTKIETRNNTNDISSEDESYTQDQNKETIDDKTTNKNNIESEKENDIIYKIQILTSDKKLTSKDKQFKGYNEISYYKDKGLYKYTYGETTDLHEISKLYKKASKDFKGAFIIKFKNGKRLK